MPRFITKYGRPLPAFMRYASPYYARQDLSNAPSNMNKLCREIERWHKQVRWRKYEKDFPYQIMIDNTIPTDEMKQESIFEIYKRFNKVSTLLRKESYKKYDKSLCQTIPECAKYIVCGEDGRNDINWSSFYADIRSECMTVLGDIRAVANDAVRICYEKRPSASKSFIWKIASDGVVQNIKQVPIKLPVRDENGTERYLGKTYKWEDYSI